MTRRALSTGLAGLAWTLAMLAGGCAPTEESVSTVPADEAASVLAALPPVTLPDLSSQAESVQEQVRERYASLVDSTERGAPPGERGTAYGELGLILMASGYRTATISSG